MVDKYNNRDERHTTDGKPPTLTPASSTPQPIDPQTGMAGAYWVLSEEERSGGFVRPVRLVYTHVGRPNIYPRRPLTDEEKVEHAAHGYVAFEAYPEGSPESDGGAKTGRYLTAATLKSGCGARTSMARALAETYAKQPDYYGATFCIQCKTHLPVGADGEFIWDDGSRVGT